MNAISGEQLKPCPFCGTPALIERNSLGSWLVHCSRYNEGDQETDCPCCPELKSMHDTRESAIEAWNTRALTQPLKPSSEEVGRAIDLLSGWIHSAENVGFEPDGRVVVTSAELKTILSCLRNTPAKENAGERIIY